MAERRRLLGANVLKQAAVTDASISYKQPSWWAVRHKTGVYRARAPGPARTCNMF